MHENTTALNRNIGKYPEFTAHLNAMLAKSAAFAWDLAEQCCNTNSNSGKPCAIYHKIWQYLLLLGVTSSTRTDSDFLIDGFCNVIDQFERPKVLISGTADYSMLAHLLYACQLKEVSLDITVLDLCETPLKLNQWYAEQHNCEITVVQEDATRYQAENTFHMICTHSFLGWFTPSQQRKLVKCWYRNLRTGGVLMTTKRVRPQAKTDEISLFEEQDAINFQKRVYQSALSNPDLIAVSPDILADAGYAYAGAFAQYQFSNKEDLYNRIKEGGFEQVTITADKSVASVKDKPSGPQKNAGTRLRIIAHKTG